MSLQFNAAVHYKLQTPSAMSCLLKQIIHYLMHLKIKPFTNHELCKIIEF